MDDPLQRARRERRKALMYLGVFLAVAFVIQFVRAVLPGPSGPVDTPPATAVTELER